MSISTWVFIEILQFLNLDLDFWLGLKEKKKTIVKYLQSDPSNR